MKRNTSLFVLLALLLVSSCQSPEVKEIHLVPKPTSLQQSAGTFELTESTTMSYSDENSRLKEIADHTVALISEYTSLTVDTKNEAGDIEFVLKNLADSNAEAYELEVTSNKITIAANTPSGIFYGVQTLRQLIPPVKSASVSIPNCTIKDAPRFSWRGLHLDVCRHFFPKNEIFRFIDLMSMYKVNKFHWHLTEDQGWRIEIKKYPKLTEVGAWRSSVGFKSNQEKGLNIDDGSRYGGFYTQEEVKEIVEYARLHNITVVPEIEMPGHSTAAMVAYPELACFPKEKREILTEGGVSDGVVCAGKENTFTFLTDVLDEVLVLFPSEYIHIGGDEAPKRNWQRCPNCQKRISKEGLHDEHELQSYLIKRIEKHLNSNGRKLVGWDEILEGGVSKTATVMSWRGVTPGMEAAEVGNKVVMTPGMPCYFDFPQSVNEVTKATGAVRTMRDMYEFLPVPAGLSKEAQKNIIGLQACQWTEYTPNLRTLEYKEYPRAIATAEVAWTQDETKDWDDFYARYESNRTYLDFHKVNYGQRSYDVRINLVPGPKNEKMYAEFTTEVPGAIYYTLNGEEPTTASSVYTSPIQITENGTIKARMYREDGSEGRVASQDVLFHKALGKKVSYAINYSSKHDGGGAYAMTNGLVKKWQGFEKRDIDLTVDLGAVTKVSTIKTQWWFDIGDWVWKPTEVTYEVSTDGVEFEEVFRFTHTQPKGVQDKGVLPLEQTLDKKPVRYIRLKAKNIMQNPAWHGSAGGASWIFVDEVFVK